MILQALTDCYETLLENKKISPPGWSETGVSFALNIAGNGELIDVKPMKKKKEIPQKGDKKKEVWLPRPMRLPNQVKRSANISPNFLCDNGSYFLALDAKGDKKRSIEYFEASKKFHKTLLESCNSLPARAIIYFMSRWNPVRPEEHPALQKYLDEIKKGGNIVFLCNGVFAQDDPAIRAAWNNYYRQEEKQGDTMRCLVTGKKAPVAVLHPSIRGVYGAQAMGVSLVSFNSSAFESYGRQQGRNAPVSKYAAFAYGSALNYLLSSEHYHSYCGDLTFVYWAQTAEEPYTDFMSMMTNPPSGEEVERELEAYVKALMKGKAIKFENIELDLNTRFYFMGLMPVTARLSVRFFLTNSFGDMMKNLAAHYERLKIESPYAKPLNEMAPWLLLSETTRKGAKNQKAESNLVGELMQSILTGGPYPATLLNGVMLRIHADGFITYRRAAIISAYLMHNLHGKQYKTLKEAIGTMNLNEETTYTPYVLGRVFAVLEQVQKAALPTITATIKDRYYNSACATPALVFPTLLKLNMSHMKKVKAKQPGLEGYFDNLLTELLGVSLGEKLKLGLPTHLNLQEQGAFILGYYYQKANPTKKEEKEEK